MRRTTCFVTATGLLFLLTVLAATPALAHEERDVGKYHFAVGFGDEPAYAGLENSAQLLLSDRKGKPVTDLGDSLKVTVEYGKQSKKLSLDPFFEIGESGIPGDYRAWFFPTSPGSYTFHFTGSIHGQKVDEKFTSGSKTFDKVVDPASVQFPQKVPTIGEVAGRITREVPRLHKDIAAMASSAKDASDKANGAGTTGVIGIAIGTVGLLVAIAALLLARRKRA